MIELLVKLFAHPLATAKELTWRIHTTGRAIVLNDAQGEGRAEARPGPGVRARPEDEHLQGPARVLHRAGVSRRAGSAVPRGLSPPAATVQARPALRFGYRGTPDVTPSEAVHQAVRDPSVDLVASGFSVRGGGTRRTWGAGHRAGWPRASNTRRASTGRSLADAGRGVGLAASSAATEAWTASSMWTRFRVSARVARDGLTALEHRPTNDSFRPVEAREPEDDRGRVTPLAQAPGTARPPGRLCPPR